MWRYGPSLRSKTSANLTQPGTCKHLCSNFSEELIWMQFLENFPRYLRTLIFIFAHANWFPGPFPLVVGGGKDPGNEVVARGLKIVLNKEVMNSSSRLLSVPPFLFFLPAPSLLHPFPYHLQLYLWGPQVTEIKEY